MLNTPASCCAPHKRKGSDMTPGMKEVVVLVVLFLHMSASAASFTCVTVAFPSTSCVSANGSLLIIATGGSGTYDYSINGGMVRQENNSFSSLPPSQYVCIVRDLIGGGEIGCIGNITGFLPYTVTVTASVPIPLCSTDPAFVYASASNGVPPYSYSLDGEDFNTDSTISGATAGQHYVVARDSNFCNSSMLNIDVNLPEGISITVYPGNQKCPGTKTGSVGFAASGGKTASGSYTFYVDDIKFTEADILYVFPGTHNVTVVDDAGCVATTPVYILPAPEITVIEATAPTTTCKSYDGAVTISLSNGLAPYNFTSDRVNYVSVGSQFTVNGLPSGPFTYYIVDSNSCAFNQTVIIPSFNSMITVTLNHTNIKCFSYGSTASLTLLPSSGTPPYSYSLDNGASFGNESTFSSLAPGIYKAVVRDSRSCYYALPPANITRPPELQLKTQVFTQVCAGTPSGAVLLRAEGGTAIYSYQFEGSITTSSGAISFPSFSGLFVAYVSDGNGCTANASVAVPGNPVILVSAHNVTQGQCPTRNITFEASGGVGNLTFSLNSSEPQLSPSFTALLPGNYSWRVMDSLGCSVDGYVTLDECCHGYEKAQGGLCIDIDECKNNLGGCDQIVKCTNGPGNWTCGPCPLGYSGSGYSFCNTTCGDHICTPGVEDCVNCYKDCQSLTCKICGDGFCDKNYGENCTSCFADCGSCEKSCPSNCTGHGACVNGGCVCEGNWTNPICSSPKGEPFTITPDPEAPKVNLTSSGNNGGGPAQFYISIKSIGEIDSSKQLIRSFRIADLNFTYTVSTNGSNTLLNYSTSIEKGVTMNILIYKFEEPTLIDFANTTMNFPAHTLKVSVQVQKWRFYSLSNSLVIVMDPLGTSPDSNPCTGTSEDDSLRWVMTVVSNVTLYGQFIDKAELDGRVRGVKYEYKTDGITATIPHFWDYAVMDPNFNVLLGDYKDSDVCQGNKLNGHKRDKVNKKVIAIVVPIVVVGIALAAVAVLLYPRMVTWRALRKARGLQLVQSTEMPVVHTIEKIDYLEVRSAAGVHNVRL